jgi:hypothetical protein
MWKSLKRWPVLLALLVAVGPLAIKEGMTEPEVRAIVGKPWDRALTLQYLARGRPLQSGLGEVRGDLAARCECLQVRPTVAAMKLTVLCKQPFAS